MIDTDNEYLNHWQLAGLLMVFIIVMPICFVLAILGWTGD